MSKLRYHIAVMAAKFSKVNHPPFGAQRHAYPRRCCQKNLPGFHGAGTEGTALYLRDRYER